MFILNTQSFFIIFINFRTKMQKSNDKNKMLKRTTKFVKIQEKKERGKIILSLKYV